MQIPVEWLTERVEDIPTSYHQNLSPSAALRARMAWQKLKRQAGEGDELWSFSAPPTAWKKEGRYIGFALVRDGTILQSAIISQD